MMVGEKLRQLRNLKKITQKQVSKETGISCTTLSNYELGNRYPDVFNLEKLAKYYNVTSDYLLGIEDINTINKEFLINQIDKQIESLEILKKYIMQVK